MQPAFQSETRHLYRRNRFLGMAFLLLIGTAIGIGTGYLIFVRNPFCHTEDYINKRLLDQAVSHMKLQAMIWKDYRNMAKADTLKDHASIADMKLMIPKQAFDNFRKGNVIIGSLILSIEDREKNQKRAPYIDPAIYNTFMEAEQVTKEIAQERNEICRRLEQYLLTIP